MGLVFRIDNLGDASGDALAAAYIYEQASIAAIQPVGAGVIHMACQTKHGTVDSPTVIVSVGHFITTFGGPGGTQLPGVGYGGFRAYKIMAPPKIYVTRVLDTAAVLGTLNLLQTATPVVQIDAKSKGLWGNSLTVQVLNSGASLKVVYQDGLNSYLKQYDGLDNTSEATFNATWGEAISGPASDPYIDVTFLAITDPDDLAATNLASGADGTADATDYTATGRGIDAANDLTDINILTYDDLADLDAAARDTVNVAVETQIQAQKDKIAIICGPAGQARATAVTDVADYRDKRIMYSYPWVKGTHPDISTSKITESPAALLASVVANTPAHESPATAKSKNYTAFAQELDTTLEIGDLTLLKAAGIAPWRFDAGSLQLQEHVTTSITAGEKSIIESRYRLRLGSEAGLFLANLVNLNMTTTWKKQVKGAFNTDYARKKRLEELKRYTIDLGMNDEASEAAGQYIVGVRVQMYPPGTHLIALIDAGTGVLLS